MKTICVFCGSSEDLDQRFYFHAQELGKQIGDNKFALIHGGGIIGLMGHLSKSAAKNGAKVIGVVPEKLNKSNIVCDSYQELVVTVDMKGRKDYMRENSDAFIALPGGFGTIEELMEVITLKQLKYHTKPIVIINYSNFYDNLLKQFDTIFLENFANYSYSKLYHVCNSVSEALNYIKNYSFINIFDKYLKE